MQYFRLLVFRWYVELLLFLGSPNIEHANWMVVTIRVDTAVSKISYAIDMNCDISLPTTLLVTEFHIEAPQVAISNALKRSHTIIRVVSLPTNNVDKRNHHSYTYSPSLSVSISALSAGSTLSALGFSS
jgi:hypothetical protein